MREGDFEGIKEWAETRCRPASVDPKVTVNLGIDGDKDIDI
jgi:hypothetical protein